MSRAPAKQFVVGDKSQGADFSVQEIETLIYKVALWFQSPDSDRKYDDPVATATDKIQECLLATTESGDPWRNCPADFSKRVRAKCAYDMESGKGIRSAPKRKDGGRDLNPKAKAGAKDLDDSNPVAAAFDQDGFRAKLEKDLLVAFPELDNAAHLPTLRSLTLYHAQREVIDRELQTGVNATKRNDLLESLKTIEQMADITMRRMGIHPDQIRKNLSDKGKSSVADLVALIGDDAEFLKREKTWVLQLALQLWWMSEHHNGRRTGPQLHDFEIWHMTRSRPMEFTCRHGETYTLVEGFEPRELKDFLIREGVLIEEPVLPGLIAAEALSGLTEYLETDGNYAETTNGVNGAGGGVDSANSDDQASTPRPADPDNNGSAA